MSDNLDIMEINELAKNAMGGTELALRRIYDGKIPRDLLEQFQIIPTRVRDLSPDKWRILYMHDLPNDPEVMHLKDNGWNKFHRIVFVSNWQCQHFIDHFNIPWSKCVVLANAIDPIPVVEKPRDKVRIVYHTTPHRGLNILVPVFNHLAKQYPNIELDVFSSFGLYGWAQRDEEFKEILDQAKNSERVNYHGAVSNEEIRKFLGETPHIFAYPSVWPETSCFCLIEAMSAGLLCVHPNYGALYETAANWTSMYNYHEDQQEHAKLFCMMLENAIQNVFEDNMQGRLQAQKTYTDAFYSWPMRAKQWESLLHSIEASEEPKTIEEDQFVYNYNIG
jgi:UDP-glucose:(glucosyl)LPS alpha-1,2-glucosyltransferase